MLLFIRHYKHLQETCSWCLLHVTIMPAVTWGRKKCKFQPKVKFTKTNLQILLQCRKKLKGKIPEVPSELIKIMSDPLFEDSFKFSLNFLRMFMTLNTTSIALSDIMHRVKLSTIGCTDFSAHWATSKRYRKWCMDLLGFGPWAKTLRVR